MVSRSKMSYTINYSWNMDFVIVQFMIDYWILGTPLSDKHSQGDPTPAFYFQTVVEIHIFLFTMESHCLGTPNIEKTQKNGCVLRSN